MKPDFAGVLREHARQRGGAPSLSFDGVTLSYADLDERSTRLASALLARGLERGERVALFARNAPVFFELAFACAKSGLIMLPLNWRLSPREIKDILADATPSLVLVDVEFGSLLPPGIPQIHLTDYSSWLDTASSDEPSIEPGADDTVLLLYTSGTTGQPKGAMITHRNLMCTQRMASEKWRFTRESVNLVAMPLFHIGGIGYGMMALTQGGHTVLLQQPTAQPVVRAISEYRITHAFFVPAVIQALVDIEEVELDAVSSLELIVYGASPISDALLSRSMALFGCGFSHAYGLTESAGTVITLDPEDHEVYGEYSHRLRSCGKPVPWVEISLFDPDTMIPVETGDVGEICVRSDMVMRGYWNNPAETAATITPEGWLRTGDAAFMDSDGYFYIHDRYKDMIVSGGENIYPTEVENVLYEHPAVSETAVIGVPHPRWGETPEAVVVVRSGEQLDADGLIAFARDRLAHYKCPTSVRVVDSMPRSASGKILKRELRAQAEREHGSRE